MADQTRTSGQAVARTDGKFPDVSVAAGHKGFKAEQDGLRDRMRGLGSTMTRSRPRSAAGTGHARVTRTRRGRGCAAWRVTRA